MDVQSVARIEFLPMQRSDLDAVLAIEHEVFPYPWTRGNFNDSLDRATWLGCAAETI